MELPDRCDYCYIFKYDDYMFNKIQEFLSDENKCICVVDYVDYYFTKRTMPKVTMPKDKELKLNNLPLMDIAQLEKLKEVCKLFNENKGAQFQINNGTKYRIPTRILDMSSSPILTLNEKKVFEKLLLTITNSTFAITRSTSTPYRIKFKDFLKGLKLSRSSQTQKELVEECFQNLQKFNLMEAYEIDESGMLTFYATSLSEKIKSQNTQREFGFYNNVPKTKQNNIISAWLDYLYMIHSFTRHNKTLQISLDSLLAKLELRHLQDKHRLGDIAKILNTLLETSNGYGLTKGECVFDTKIVKELFKDRQGLKKYIILSDNGEKLKENEND